MFLPIIITCQTRNYVVTKQIYFVGCMGRPYVRILKEARKRVKHALLASRRVVNDDKVGVWTWRTSSFCGETSACFGNMHPPLHKGVDPTWMSWARALGLGRLGHHLGPQQEKGKIDIYIYFFFKLFFWRYKKKKLALHFSSTFKKSQKIE